MPFFLLSGPRKTTSHQFTGHQPAGHQPTSPLYPRPHDPENESPPMSSCVKKDEHSEFLPTNRVVSPPDDPMTLGQAQPIDTAAATTKGKEKAWKDAEDAGIGTNVNNARRQQQNFHLDLATGGLTYETEDEGQNLLESPGSGLHRISSESTFQQSDLDSTRQNDPYRMLERSQSDASLLKRVSQVAPTVLNPACM